MGNMCDSVEKKELDQRNKEIEKQMMQDHMEASKVVKLREFFLSFRRRCSTAGGKSSQKTSIFSPPRSWRMRKIDNFETNENSAR